MSPLAFRRARLAFAAAALALAACERLDTAIDPVWGKEPCGHCAMLVGDRRFAAQVVADGQRKWFDDVGCFVLWADEHPGKVERAWVRDAGGSGWVDAKGARYASGARTPMDFGFEGHTADTAGVSYDEMRAAVVARARSER